MSGKGRTASTPNKKRTSSKQTPEVSPEQQHKHKKTQLERTSTGNNVMEANIVVSVNQTVSLCLYCLMFYQEVTIDLNSVAGPESTSVPSNVDVGISNER